MVCSEWKPHFRSNVWRMDNIIFHLSTCSTCQKILKRIPKVKRFTLQDIKTEAITAKQLDALKKVAGSYEALFTRRSMKYRSMGLQDQEAWREGLPSLDPCRVHLPETTRDAGERTTLHRQREQGSGRSDRRRQGVSIECAQHDASTVGSL